MQIDWDAPIEMDDSAIVYADVLCPAASGKYPVILTHGVYGKELPIERLRHRLFKLANSMSNKQLVMFLVLILQKPLNLKWLESHARGQFDDEISVDLQRRFFDYHLKEIQNNWDDQPPVQLALRQPDGSSAVVDADP